MQQAWAHYVSVQGVLRWHMAKIVFLNCKDCGDRLVVIDAKVIICNALSDYLALVASHKDYPRIAAS